jgi:hypothetical protein
LTLALPMARFYTRSLYWDMSLAGLRATGGPSQAAVPPADRTGRGTKEPYLAPLGPRERPWTKVRLSRQSLRDLAYWRSLTRGEGRDLHPLPADLTMQSDAADLGYGGTLGTCSEAGSPGLWEGRGLWQTAERAESITLRELKAVRLFLQRHFASYVAKADTRQILLHEDNQSVVHILTRWPLHPAR